MRSLCRLLVSALVWLVGGAGCQTAGDLAPSPESWSPAAHFELAVAEALAYFEERALDCLGPETPLPDPREWLCRAQLESGAGLDVRVVGDEEGVSQIVAVAHELTADDAVAHLVGAVASLVVTGPDAEAMRLWATDNPDAGRTWTFPGVEVRLSAHSEARGVVVTAVP
jgi:hypothetical protein